MISVTALQIAMWSIGFAAIVSVVRALSLGGRDRGELCVALAVSLDDLALKTRNPKIKILAKGLTSATGKLLDHNKSPGRKVGEIDNRAAHFYIAMWWAEAVARSFPSFKALARKLKESEDVIVKEMTECHPALIRVVK